jgi:hypothetical protein
MSSESIAWIETYSGVPFDIFLHTQEDIRIEDIAHSLAHQCRYSGHTAEFYSVAEHSVWMSYLVKESEAFLALMHDSTEAYLSDVARPIKFLIPRYYELESILWHSIAKKYSLPSELPDTIKRMDLAMLKTEKESLLTGDCPREWESLIGVTAADFHVECWTHKQAYNRFIKRFKELYNEPT